MAAGLELWRVRVGNANGRICGAGILVDGWHVLTCAHVFAEAVAGDRHGAPPAGVAEIHFPSALGETRQAAVTSDGWVPVAPDGRGDLAMLVLDRPAPAALTPAPLDLCGDSVNDRVIDAYGHPRGMDDGVWARTRLMGPGGPNNEWVQIDGHGPTGRRVERGFSGAGALDRSTGTVIGLVVAEDRVVENRVAWIVPIETVIRYLPRIHSRLPQRAAPPILPGSRRSPESGGLLERQIGPQTQRELFERLWAVPDMPNRDTREFYLQRLETHVGETLTFYRHPTNDAFDVRAIMYALLERPGGVRALTEVLLDFHPYSPEVQRLEELVERTFPDLLLRNPERTELEARLAGVTWSTVVAGFRNATSSLSVPPMIEGSGLEAVIRQLESLGTLRGGPPPPLLVFVDDLAHKLDRRTDQALHVWLAKVGDRLGLDPNAVRSLCMDAERRQQETGRVSFVVQLRPDRTGQDRYLLAAWLEWEGNQTHTVLRDDEPRTLPAVAHVVDDLLHDVNQNAIADIDELTVEFIVPRRLVAEPFHLWRYDRRSFPRPLGIRFAVVVRVLERQHDVASQDEWRRKSRLLTDDGNRPDPASIHCVLDPTDADPVALYSDLAEGPVTCVAVPFPPEREQDPSTGVFAAALAAGLPLVAWSTEPTEPAAFCDLVRSDLAAEGLLKLPGRLLSYRRNALKTVRRVPKQDQPRSGVSVIFDRFERRPDLLDHPLRLRAPRQGGNL